MDQLETFKKSAHRAETYLQAQGVVVPHAVLLEALARYEGERNYRTLRAQLSKKAPPRVDAPQLLNPDETLFVVVEAFGGGGIDVPSGRPQYVAFRVTQAALDSLYRAQQLSMENSADLDGEFIERHYLGNEWSFGFDEVTVSRGSFYAKGCEDHSDAEFETNSVQLKALLSALKEAKRTDARVIFWDFTEDKAQQAIEEVLDADESGDTSEALMDIFDEDTLSKRLCWNTTFLG